MEKRLKVRLIDIAREADVSLATVDRTVNGRPGVNQATVERIWEVVRKLETVARVVRPRSAWRTRLTFGFILPAGPNTFMQNLNMAILKTGDAFAEQGINVQCHRIEGFNPTALADAIHQLGETSNGLAVAALDNPIVREAVNTVTEKGVPVVTLVCDLSNGRQIGYVGLDNRAAGRTAGYLMGRFAGQRRGQIALVSGSIGVSYRDHQEREFGFRDAVHEQFKNVEIADGFEDQDDFRKAYEQTNIILDRYPDLLGIYNVGAGNRGIGLALQERGADDRVIFIGHELTDFSRQFLIEGVMDAIINQDVGHEASEALRLLLQHHMRPFPSPPLGQPRVEVFLRENLP